ncbi:CHASE3 domain-containing protein [Candidatus Saccharibacteria bacterium]|nr:CHASE3 domain-containing protein [Candidatus Saccharibacteria bacterium]
MALSFRRSYVDRRVFTALSILALFSLSTTFVTIGAVTKMVSSRQEGLNYSNARTTLGDLLTELNAAESAQRGYLLVEDKTYLEPYNMAIKVIPGDVTTLQAQLAGTPYSTTMSTIYPLVNQKLAELASTITANDTQGHDAAISIVAAADGQSRMSKIRTIITSILDNLNGEVSAARVEVNQYASWARDIGLLALGGTLVLVVGIYFLFDHAIEAERALDQAKDEFVSLASHQLRTPATGIKSILSMLEHGDFGPLTDRQHNVVSKAVRSNARELAIIEELLNVAKADAGRLVLKPVELDLGKLVEQVVGEQQAAYTTKYIALGLHQPSHTVKLLADEEKLYMAITNLVDNARKYTPEGGSVTVTIANHRNHVSIEVADSGIGIDEHELDHIFDRFQRSRMVLAGTIEGTGLGLYLARRIAELHHGTINVDSKKDHGSRFTMILPRRPQS